MSATTLTRPNPLDHITAPSDEQVRQGINQGVRRVAYGATQVAQEHAETTTLTEKEYAIAKRIEFVARLMDNAVRIPGTDYYVGLDPLLGLAPGWGDVISGGISVYVLIEAIRLGAPPEVLGRMGFNIALDIGMGLVPGIGDTFDAIFKANQQNAMIVRRDVLQLPEPTDPARWSFEDVEIVDADFEEKVQPQAMSEVAAEPAMLAAAQPQAQEAATHAQVATKPVEKPIFNFGTAPQNPQAMATRPRPRIRVIKGDNSTRRETSFFQKAVGYSLAFALVSLFTLPWAVLAYFTFQ